MTRPCTSSVIASSVASTSSSTSAGSRHATIDAPTSSSHSSTSPQSIYGCVECGFVLVVWDLDRAFRSVVDAVTQTERFRQKGIEFEIVNLQVDTVTPSGMLVYTIMSAFAEFERRMLAQRTREGLAAARRRGTRLGRPPKLSKAQLDHARQILSCDSTATPRIARQLGVAPWTLTRSLRRQDN